MVKNYLKVAMRNISRHKFFSVINILGLTIGIAACLFVSMYIYDELTYDHFHEKGERIYRMNLHGKLGGQEIYTTSTSFPMSRALVDEIPEVEEATRVNDMGEWIFRNGSIAFNEEGIVAADSNFFSVFSFKLYEGNPETALRDPQSLVISQKLAEKYFGNESALGKTLSIGNNKKEYQVTGVMENERGDSHLKFNAIISTASFAWMNRGTWLDNSVYTYYVLNKNGSPEDVDAKLEPIMERNVTPVLKDFLGKSLAEFRKEGGIYTYFSMPLYDIHLRSEMQDEPEPPGDMAYVYILAGIGLFIVILACINFMNLTTAKSAGRAKEVGLRKTLGSLRSTLITQFLTESMIYAFSAGILAVVLVYLLLPLFNLMSGKVLMFSTLLNPIIAVTGVLLILFVGFLAGSYPAFYLTSFRITEVLKGKLRAGMKSGGIRSFLVTFQFWISIVLIICTAIVYQQLQYVQNKNLGIDKEHIVIVEDVDRLENNKMAFKNALDAGSGVLGTSFSNNMVPGVNQTTVYRASGDDEDKILATYFTDYDHAKTLGIEMVDGRFFSRDFKSDSMACIINEAAAREFDFDNPLEEKVIDFNGEQPRELQVVGVMKDFNFESLKINVRPLILKFTETGNILYVRFSGEQPEDVLATIEANWDEMVPGEPLQYSFLDEDFDALFRAEQRLGTVFTIVAIFIACLGLFGLAAFMAEQRTKEIGIRKVMGASLWSVTSLMSKEFAKLVIIAFVLAIYPSYYVMNSWLNDFANRIEINVWVFAVSGILAIAIAWLTVSYQSLKAARVNPVKSLRYE
ncbi:FtsX-like permease family protein [Fulvivirga sp. RKSG066]|uniref:ABC transporter permease n=1 Tax=Fulvivirga aurantia TaxID=2529383 RepID=UPI0012BC3D6E|nr:ABC transporter permease [Fulvivirga aurantia]MTI23324.1 FtsX-like permease family protein [Fulvivirga aurantia]